MDAVESFRAAPVAADPDANRLNQPMETTNLPPRTSGSSRIVAGPGWLPAAAQAETAAAHIASETLDGLRWTFRNGFERVLAEVPAAAWAEPGKQGWQRVKDNATREVWRATIAGGTYYLKYYIRRAGKDSLKRLFRDPPCQAEWNGGIYARRAGIAAVRPAGYTVELRCGGRPRSLLVTEAVEPAYALSEYWQTLQSDEDAHRRRHDTARLVELLAEMIARAHQAGFEHRDMHAANILAQVVVPGRYRTVFVDLQSARLGVPVSDRAVVRNLAQLNQWFRRHGTLADRLRFLRAYLRWRGEYETVFRHGRSLGLSFQELVQALRGAAERHAQRLWAQRDRRVRRSGRYFSRFRLDHGWRAQVFVRCKHPLPESRASTLTLTRDWWRRQLQNPLRWFQGDAAEACKDSHSATVTRAVLSHEQANLPVIIKRPRARNWRRRISQALAPSRSTRGWETGHALLHRDIVTARPLAFLERRLGPLVLDSLLITEAVPGALDLETYLRNRHAELPPSAWWRQHKRELCALLVHHIRRFQERGFAHRDCKAQNILVITQPQLELLWIDMDGVQRVGRLARAQRLLPLMRLHVSLLDVPGLTRTDRVRFLKSYFARFGSDPNAWRAAWREVSQAAESKVRAKATRRAWKLKHYGRE